MTNQDKRNNIKIFLDSSVNYSLVDKEKFTALVNMGSILCFLGLVKNMEISGGNRYSRPEIRFEDE